MFSHEKHSTGSFCIFVSPATRKASGSYRLAADSFSYNRKSYEDLNNRNYNYNRLSHATDTSN